MGQTSHLYPITNLQMLCSCSRLETRLLVMSHKDSEEFALLVVSVVCPFTTVVEIAGRIKYYPIGTWQRLPWSLRRACKQLQMQLSILFIAERLRLLPTA